MQVFRVPWTPDDPAGAILAGVERLPAQGVEREQIVFFSHGTTVGTNVVLEERGAAVGLLVTAGMRGIAEVAEQTRPYGPGTYDLRFRRPTPLVLPALTAEVDERVGSAGEIVRGLDEDQARCAITKLLDAGAEAIAVCLLLGYLNPVHEQRLRSLIEELAPGLPISRRGAGRLLRQHRAQERHRRFAARQRTGGLDRRVPGGPPAAPHQVRGAPRTGRRDSSASSPPIAAPRRLRALLERYGLALAKAAFEELSDRTEALLRSHLSRWPDAVEEAQGRLDSVGVVLERPWIAPMAVAVPLTPSGRLRGPSPTNAIAGGSTALPGGGAARKPPTAGPLSRKFRAGGASRSHLSDTPPLILGYSPELSVPARRRRSRRGGGLGGLCCRHPSFALRPRRPLEQALRVFPLEHFRGDHLLALSGVRS